MNILKLQVKLQFNTRLFNYFEWPMQPKVLNLFLNVMAIHNPHTKIKENGYPWFQNLLWVYGMAWMSEISLPANLSKSCPVLHCGCSVMIHALANKILIVNNLILMCQYDVRSSYRRHTKTVSSNGYFLLSKC